MRFFRCATPLSMDFNTCGGNGCGGGGGGFTFGGSTGLGSSLANTRGTGGSSGLVGSFLSMNGATARPTTPTQLSKQTTPMMPPAIKRPEPPLFAGAVGGSDGVGG